MILWDVCRGDCLNNFGEHDSAVLQLECTIANVVGLFSDGCLRVWSVISGDLTRTISLVRQFSVPTWYCSHVSLLDHGKTHGVHHFDHSLSRSVSPA